MKAETLKALKGSIRKWKRIVKGTGADEGYDNCPLCKIFNTGKDNSCEGCPIMKKVGIDSCDSTPHETWLLHHHLNHALYCPNKVHTDCDDCKRLATAELEFLKSLLPKKKKAAHND